MKHHLIAHNVRPIDLTQLMMNFYRCYTLCIQKLQGDPFGKTQNEYIIKGELYLFIVQYAFLKHGSFVQISLDLNMTTIS